MPAPVEKYFGLEGLSSDVLITEDGAYIFAPEDAYVPPTYSIHTSFADPLPSNDIIRVTASRTRGALTESFTAGRVSVVLDNTGGKYSPENPQSSYYGLMTLNSSLMIEGHMDTGSSYTIFTGKIDGFNLAPQLGQQTITVNATDRSKELFDKRVNTPVYSLTTPTSLIADVLSLAGVAASERVIDTIYDNIKQASFKNESVISVLNKVMQFGNYSYFMDPEGRVNFRGRYFGIGGSVIQSFANEFAGLTYAYTDDFITNDVAISGFTYKVLSQTDTISWIEDIPSIPAAGAISFWLDYKDPTTTGRDTIATSMTCVQSVDFFANDVSDGSGTDRTSTVSADITYFGKTALCSISTVHSGAIYLTKFQLRGSPIEEQPTFRVITEDSSSQAVYGKKSLSIKNELIQSYLYGTDYGEFLINERKNPRANVTFSIKNYFPEVYTLELGDVVTLVESNTGLSGNWVITGIDHDISVQQGIEHTTRFKAQYWVPQDYLVLDHPTNGILDDVNKLGF